ncbi:MAG: synthase-Glutamine amidotransferase domain [Chthoniobacteraceae bacterium]|nr:synthase-Glutamine amidotransferase domain [Chthoniobacteraceae bacterium]
MGECGVELETVHLWRGENLPSTLDRFDGLAVGGGEMSAYETERYPFLKEELTLIQAARSADKPILGICLGAQLMAAAFGGAVFPNKGKEIGLFDLSFTSAANDDPLWKGFTTAFAPVHWHGDTFSLPPGAELLASSTLTPNQLFHVDHRHYGLQFHLEIDRVSLREMIAADAEPLRASGVDPEAFLRAGESLLPSVEPIGRAIFARWATLLHNSIP